MEYRPLGGTGISVSELCLGAMMFGAFGNSDHAEATRIVHRALDAGINIIDTADGYSAGESETILGKALAGRRDDVLLAVKFGVALGAGDPESAWSLAPLDCRGRRGIASAPADRLDRPLPSWDARPPDRHRRDPQCSERSRASGQDPGLRRLQGATLANRRGANDRRAPRSRALSQRAIAVQHADSAGRVRSTADRARHGVGVMAFGPLVGGWLSGRHRHGQASAGPGAAIRQSSAFDVEQPANADKLDVAIRLGTLAEEAGLTLIQMATAFVLNHPAVSTCIVGPRTEQHLDGYLAADGLKLSDELLDRIDEIVAPGATIKLADNMWQFGTTNLRSDKLRRH